MRATGFGITGIGAVTAWGWGVGPLWRGLMSGRSAIGPFDRFDSSLHRTHIAGEVSDPLRGIPDDATRLSIADRFAVFAAQEALDRAGLDRAALDARDVGVFFGSSTGGMFEAERFYRELIGPADGPMRVSLLSSQQCNGPGDAVAREIGACGPVVTISTACTTGTLAVGAALDALREGAVDIAVAGGSDSLCEITYGGFNALRSVDERPSRPFRADRSGLSIGEGAGVLVLERLESARARGVEPLVEILGYGCTCDAHHMTAPDPSGRGPAAAIAAALEDAGIAAGEIDFVNAHGTGTPHNDAAECAALKIVFGERTPLIPITSTKAVIGHLLGSSGAIEAAVTALCLLAGVVHPTPGSDPGDPALGVDLAAGSPRPCPGARAAVSTNLAFGGSNAAVVLRRRTPGAP